MYACQTIGRKYQHRFPEEKISLVQNNYFKAHKIILTIKTFTSYVETFGANTTSKLVEYLKT